MNKNIRLSLVLLLGAIVDDHCRISVQFELIISYEESEWWESDGGGLKERGK